jgi:hypothetical protein
MHSDLIQEAELAEAPIEETVQGEVDRQLNIL